MLVRPWRAVLAPSYQLLPGGKGSNQAFAAAKVGAANVEFIGCVGDDGFAARAYTRPLFSSTSAPSV